MTTPSQAVFERHFKDFYDLPDTEFPKFNGSYTQSHQHREYAHWQAAEAYGRKQSMEDAIAFFKANAEVVRTTALEEAVELANEWAMKHVIEDNARYSVGDYIIKEMLK